MKKLAIFNFSYALILAFLITTACVVGGKGATTVGNTSAKPQAITLGQVVQQSATVYIPIPIYRYTLSNLGEVTLDLFINDAPVMLDVNALAFYQSSVEGVVLPIAPVVDGDQLLLKVKDPTGELQFIGTFSDDKVTTAIPISIGTEGTAMTDFTPGDAIWPDFITPDDDNTLLVIGRSGSKLFGALYDEFGQPAIGLNGTGTLSADLSSYFPESTLDLWKSATDSQGRIILIGTTNPKDNDFDQSLFITRLTAEGTLDVSFGSQGFISTTIEDNFNGLVSSNDIAIDNSDNLFIAADANFRAYVIKYTADGVLDSTFGSEGKQFISKTGNNGTSNLQLAVASDQTLWAGTSAPNATDFFVYHIGASGAFLALAKINSDVHDVMDMDFDSTGSIVLLGQNNLHENNLSTGYSLARFKADGTADSWKDGNSVISFNFGLGSSAKALRIDSKDRIVVAGDVNNASLDALLARHLPNGDLDTNFNGTGTAIFNSGCGEFFTVLTIAPDDSIRAAGVINNIFSTVSYGENGLQDFSFGDSAEPTECNGTF